MEKYNQLVAKCAKECTPRFYGLIKEYMEECVERRQLYNELIELGETSAYSAGAD